MKKHTLLSILLVLFSIGAMAQQISETKHGLRIDAMGSNPTTELTVYAPSIIRVTKYADGLAEMPEKKSFSVIMQPCKDKKGWSVKGNTLRTSCLTVTVDEATGKICFTDVAGNVLLCEGDVAEVTPILKGVDKGNYSIKQSFFLDTDEAIYGLGQRRSPKLNQRGESVDIWNSNANITIPYIASDKGYGLYWDNAGRSRFVDTPQKTTFSSEVAQGVDYYFFYSDGTQDGVIASIRQLTGQATMFPLWTMGHWQCRERYKTSDELCEVIDKYRELQIPLDGIVQDWQYWGCDSNWNAMDFMNPYYINKVGDGDWAKYLPDDLRPLAEEYVKKGVEPRIKSPQEMIDYAHQQNTHLMISVWANFGPWTKQYRELEAIGALYPFDTWPLNRGVKPYDPFNLQAREIYWNYLKELYAMGVDAWWTDSTEPDHFEKPGDEDYLTAAGSWRSVKNAFPLMTNKGIYEHQRQLKGNTKRSFQMTRCSSFGIQHYGAFSWSGDINSSWDSFKNQIPSGLNYILCGIPYWNTDIGGFFCWDYNNNPRDPFAQELQVRWMQWGCFMPLMRNHCSSPMVNELYRYGKPGHWAFDVQKKYIELRYRLLPYIYSNCGDVVQRSGSMMRALVMDFPKDKRAINLTDEYLFGRNLLVKPITDPLYTYLDKSRVGHAIYPEVERAAAPVDVYLPAGTDWWDFWSNERYAGGQTVQRLAPIDIMPVYVKAGGIIPFGPEVQYASEKPWDNLEIRVYPGANGDFILYEDEGDNYNYEKGDFTEIPFHWDEDHGILIIGARQGKYKGMLAERNFRIHLVGKDSPSGDIEANEALTVVTYTGKEVSVKLCEGTVPDGMKDVTASYIANPSFEADGKAGVKMKPQGWTVDSPTAWWGVNRGEGGGDPAATHGSYVFGVWDGTNNPTASISQVITSLPKGDYELRVDMHASNSNNAIRVGKQRLFAGKTMVYFRDQISNPGVGDSYPMQTIKLRFTQTVDKVPLTIGVATDGAPAETWFKIDNFRLYRVEM